jgi:hypothetical protein
MVTSDPGSEVQGEGGERLFATRIKARNGSKITVVARKIL